MSRSRNTGTPSRAKVDTLPQERRFSERGMINNVLLELSQERADEQKKLDEEDARFIKETAHYESMFDFDDFTFPTRRSPGVQDDWDDQPDIYNDWE